MVKGMATGKHAPKHDRSELAEAIIQRVERENFGFTRRQLRLAVNALIQTFGADEDMFDWISKDNFALLVNYILDNPALGTTVSPPHVSPNMKIRDDVKVGLSKTKKKVGISSNSSALAQYKQNNPSHSRVEDLSRNIGGSVRNTDASHSSVHRCGMSRLCLDAKDSPGKLNQSSDQNIVEECILEKRAAAADGTARKKRKGCYKYGVLLSYDISRGLEKFKIPCINEYNDLMLPSDFTYIKASIISSDAHINQSLARIGDLHCSCSGNCLMSTVNCKCTSDTRGEFAYDKDGHLLPHMAVNYSSYFGRRIRMDFISECNVACTCDLQCGNRVVQRGLQYKLEVFMTKGGRGWGVRTLMPIKERSFVFEYIGEIMTNSEQYERNLDYKRNNVQKTFQMYLDADYDLERNHFNQGLNDDEALTLDATRYGNVSRFVNHRCGDPNLLLRPVQIETRDTHYYHVAFFASRDIDEREELTWDYNINFEEENHDVLGFKCLCGSKLCRDPMAKQALTI